MKGSSTAASTLVWSAVQGLQYASISKSGCRSSCAHLFSSIRRQHADKMHSVMKGSTPRLAAPTQHHKGLLQRPLLRPRTALQSRLGALFGPPLCGGSPGQLAASTADVLPPSARISTQPQRITSGGNAAMDFMAKVHLAWSIFFPPKQTEETVKEEVKKRLRMVLVADRCGMDLTTFNEMKGTIIKALQEFVDIDGEDAIDVTISAEPGLGTIYSVNIPVRRVKPGARLNPAGAFPAVADGITIEWDPTNWDSVPEGRFPMGC